MANVNNEVSRWSPPRAATWKSLVVSGSSVAWIVLVLGAVFGALFWGGGSLAAILDAAWRAHASPLIGETARRLLGESALSTAAIAERVGYQSEAAFSKAFKKAVGTGPGAYRRARAQPAVKTGAGI